MVKRIGIALTVVSHPVMIEVAWIAYWSRWHLGWIAASAALLIGISGMLYLWLQGKKRDIIMLLGSERRFLLLWHLIAIGILWSAVTEPLLYLWLSFFLWMGIWGFLLHGYKEYSFHVYGWAGLCGFYSGYAWYYARSAILLALIAGGVAYLRYWQGAHTIAEISRGALFGLLAGLGYVGFHTLMG